MTSVPPVNLVSMLHLALLGLWGGVVAAEAVLELYPYRRRELHDHAIYVHYWIDLLVELPVVIGVTTTGAVLLALVWPPSALQVVKVLCAGVAVGANLLCIILVIRRRRALDAQRQDADPWKTTGRIILCAIVGIPFAAAAAALGVALAYQRVTAGAG